MGKYDFEAKQEFRAGLVLIDVLSKFAVVVPIKSKDTPDVIEGTKEALKKMGEKPQLIYTDDERAIAGEDFKDFVEGEGIELYRTRNHPAFAERFIRTFHRRRHWTHFGPLHIHRAAVWDGLRRIHADCWTHQPSM